MAYELLGTSFQRRASVLSLHFKGIKGKRREGYEGRLQGKTTREDFEGRLREKKINKKERATREEDLRVKKTHENLKERRMEI